MQEAAKLEVSEGGRSGLNSPYAVDFTLPQVLDMRAARDFKRSLETIYALGRPCIVDAQDVTRISTGCIQVFVAFVRAMSDSGQTLTLRQPSHALLECVQQLGLSKFLDLCKVED
jgi:anti-anti-sigma regulatory factor